MPYYDLKEQRVVNERMTGTVGHISLRRLASVLAASGELAEWEAITGIEVMEDAIRYRVEIKEV